MHGVREVLVGRIAAAHGVKGWLRVRSYTEPAENILRYSPWLLSLGESQQQYHVLGGRQHGRGVLAHLQGVNDRNAAQMLSGAEVRVARTAFAVPGKDCHYWADLLGMRVVNRAGDALGVVDELMRTGANDVMVLIGDRRRLVPYLPGRTIMNVDLEQGVITVDWERDF